MRMWLVPPKLMCRQHLLGEHVEMHMFHGTIKRGISLTGYLDNGLLDTSKLSKRHSELVKEMERRGFNHKSPLIYKDQLKLGVGLIRPEASLKELARRCPECRGRILSASQ